MTSIPSLPSVTYAPAPAIDAGKSARAPSQRPDFQSQLKAQSTPSVVSGQATIQEPTVDVSRRPDVEAMLQSLAMRKLTLYAPSKVARTGPVASTHGTAIPDDDTFLLSTEAINSARADEHSTVPCSALNQGRAMWCPDAGENAVHVQVPFGSGLNTAAIAVALSGSTLIWLPCEIVRAPLQSSRVRPVRRRNACAADGQPTDQSDLTSPLST